VIGMEQNPSIIGREPIVPLTERMYKNLGKSQDGGDDAEMSLVHGCKEPPQRGKIKGVFFNEVNQRGCVKAHGGAAEGAYPFHDERSWPT